MALGQKKIVILNLSTSLCRTHLTHSHLCFDQWCWWLPNLPALCIDVHRLSETSSSFVCSGLWCGCYWYSDSCIFAVFCCVCGLFDLIFFFWFKTRRIQEQGHTGSISVKQTTEWCHRTAHGLCSKNDGGRGNGLNFRMTLQHCKLMLRNGCRVWCCHTCTLMCAHLCMPAHICLQDGYKILKIWNENDC